KSPLLPVPELERLGFKLVIFPGSAFMLVCRAVGDLMRELKQQGTTARLMDRMSSLHQCFETAGLSEMLAQDARYSEAPQAIG
ncbi:MAG: carboxyvinyl-carboxyphosphonate phosphorylmutase, partial [Chloroflexota bacterium]